MLSSSAGWDVFSGASEEKRAGLIAVKNHAINPETVKCQFATELCDSHQTFNNVKYDLLLDELQIMGVSVSHKCHVDWCCYLWHLI